MTDAPDTEHTPRDFGDVADENDYTAAQRAEKPKAEPALVWCKHMDMDIYEGTCAMCTPPEDEPVLPARTRTYAYYSGTCHSCDKPIHVGDLIELADTGWLHATCADGEQP